MDISAQYRALANGAAENLKPIPVVSSMLQEKHSIFGGADRLRACIEDVVNTYTEEQLAKIIKDYVEKDVPRFLY